MSDQSLVEWASVGLTALTGIVVACWVFYKWRIERPTGDACYIYIDTRRLLSERGKKRKYKYRPECTISELLDDVWHDLTQRGIELRPFGYGEDWVLKLDARTYLKEAGALWARRRRVQCDMRTLKEVGILPGSRVIPLIKIRLRRG